jgi:hypothetical protein
VDVVDLTLSDCDSEVIELLGSSDAELDSDAD